MAHQYEPRNAQCIDHRMYVSGRRADREIAILRRLGAAMTPEIERYRPPRRPEMLELA
jgi:hypothetical protein